MLAVVFIVALFYASDAASKIDASWTFCTGKDATECPYGKYANLTDEVFVPNPPPVGKNFTITGSGFSFEAIVDPSFDLTIQDGVFVNAHITEDGCVPYVYNFPLNDGTLIYNGIKCPVAVGPMDVVMTSYIATKAPDGTATAVLKLYDQPKQKGNCIMCTTTILKITG